MKTKSNRHYVLTLVAGLGLMASAAITSALPAAASPLPNPALTYGTLNIVHRDASYIGAPATGAQLADTAHLGGAVSGVEFTARQITEIGGEQVNLLTTRGWQLASSLEAYAAAEIYNNPALTLGPPVVSQADATGQLSKQLPIGLWWVQQTATPPGVVPGLPFLVTLPLTNPTGDGWAHQVWVYPKSDAVQIDKVVEVAGAYALGDAVTWTISADIPRGPNPITGYLIVSEVDPRLTVTGTQVQLTGTGYTLPAGAYQVWQADGQLKVQFTQSGLTQLNNQLPNPAAQVSVQVTTAVTEVGVTGVIPKQAWLLPSAEAITHFTPGTAPVLAGNPFPAVASPVNDTRWGGIDVAKTSAVTGGGLVASFQVYRTEADARAGLNPLVVPGVASHSNGGSVWTTAADGYVAINGLRLSELDVAGTSGFGGDSSHNHGGFWLVEVQAPVGYELLAEPVFFEVNDVADGVADLVITNVPANAGFALPMTGGLGERNFAAVASLVGVTGLSALGGIMAHRRKTAVIAGSLAGPDAA